MRFNCLTIYKTKVYIFNTRGVAQSGRVSALGAESRRFESCLPDHFLQPFTMTNFKTVEYFSDTFQRTFLKTDKSLLSLIEKPHLIS